MKLDFNPSSDNDFGRAMLAGRVTATVIGSDDQQVVLKFTAKAPPTDGGKRWKNVAFADAQLIDVAVPSADGGWPDKVATIYPAGSSSKWAGHVFRDRAQTDERRWLAALYVMDTISGLNKGDHVKKGDFCARCGAELWDKDSLSYGFGPECLKEVAPWLPNNSGNNHAPKDKTAPKPTADVLTSPELAHDDAGRLIPASRAQTPTVERSKPALKPDLPPAPAKPSDDTEGGSQLAFRLRAGDDPKTVLAAIDAAS